MTRLAASIGETAVVATARAHAKVNLDLRILATRADGYHELATVFQTLRLHDTLVFRAEAGPLRLACETPGLPLDRSNLVWRAAEALWRAAGRPGAPADLAITLEKRIPAQGGRGGGSADAAAALVTLNRLWSLEWPRARLAGIAATLGADVPFFLVGGTAEGRGRGDELQPLPDLPTHDVLVLVPGFGVPTADAYRWYDEAGERGSLPGEWPRDPAGWVAAFARCRNDLEPPVAARHPGIAEAVALVRRRARLAAMSGSGSAVFGLFDTPEAAGALAGEAAHLGWRVIETATLDRAGYLRSLLGGPELPGHSSFV